MNLRKAAVSFVIGILMLVAFIGMTLGLAEISEALK